MRKYGFMLCALLALGACQEHFDEEVLNLEESNVLTATIVPGAETRTTLTPMDGGVSSVLWSEDDAIGVSVDGAADFNVFKLVSGAGSKKGSFSGYGRGSSYVAYYPASGVRYMDGESFSVVLPTEQECLEGTFADGAYPMVAVSSYNELQFKALSSIIKLSLKGHQNVKRIVFRPNDPAIKVSGPARVDLSDASAPRLQMSAGGVDSLVMNIGTITLDKEVAKDFFVVLPAQTYKGGFTVRIYTTNGYMDKSLNSDFTTERGKVHSAAAFTVELTSGIDASASLSGNGIPGDPFLISSVGDLMLLQERVNFGDGLIKSEDGLDVQAATASYLLTADLDLSPVCGGSRNWTPIGYEKVAQDRYFRGTFDGGGHTISRLYIDNADMYQGLFGRISGATIRNLTVSGNIRASSFAAMLCAETDIYTRIENCVSKGRIESVGSYVGGIIGIGASTNVVYCRNEAEVIGYGYTGGIIGSCNVMVYVEDCTNVGAVSCGRTHAGGIVGENSASKLFDCINYGPVECVTRAGGVAGYILQGGKVFNCINYGEVKGQDFIGGVGGFVSSLATAYFGPGTIANCINFGDVSVSGGSHVGWLASYAGVEDDEEPYEGEPIEYAWVKNSYWLKRADDSIKGVGGGPGDVENVFALTEAQMKGAAFDGILYTAPKGKGEFNRLLDALNAGAVEWSKNGYNFQGGDRNARFPLSGWEYGSAGSYPSLTDLDAQMPGKEVPVLMIAEDTFDFNVKGGQFVLEVTSSGDYSFKNLPSWIKAGAVKDSDYKPHTHFHTFTVSANQTGSKRKAVFEVTDAAGTSLKVRVNQKDPYLNVSATEFSVIGGGGSKRIGIYSSLDWTATTAVSWLEVSPRRGHGDGAVSVRVLENKGTSAREGTLEITSEDGSVSYVVSILQSGNTGEDVGNWEELPFYHQSVAFRFTATWCFWCPYMHSSIKRAQELYPGKIQHLALHSGGSDLQFDPAGTLMNSFMALGFPTGIVDGRILVPNSDDIENVAPKFVAAAKETEEVYGTASGLAIRSTSSGQVVVVDVDAYFKLAGNYKITVLLVEDGIVHEQTNGGSDYVHDDVVRATATNILGDSFSVGNDLSKKSFHYTVTVPDGDKIENMRVFAYIQKEFGSAPKIQSDDYGDYYVDNCATVPIGESLKLALVGDSGGGSGGGNEEIGTGNEIK